MSAAERVRADTLSPYPSGWYAVAFADELRPRDVRRVQFTGEQCVLFRTASGVPVLMGAFCPHLGAHLGYGGAVELETLRCPFHGFRFEPTGACVGIPSGGPPPPSARASVYPLREVNGVLLAFSGRPSAAWEIPDLDQERWSRVRSRRWRIRAHPQEVTENSVDLGHFGVVHGYEQVEVIEPASVEGPVLRSRYAMVRPRALFGRSVRFETNIEVRGLGYSTVEVSIEEIGARARLFVLPTPVVGNQVDLRIAMQTWGSPSASLVHPALAVLPRPLWNELLSRIMFQRFKHDVGQDFKIWRHKRFVTPPALAAGDSAIGLYRRWARQFYDEDRSG